MPEAIPSGMRILGGARLSHDTDESTSIARQREQIELTTQARGDTLVHITEDTDVSGAVAPADRAGLGPWLTDPAKVAQWDGLMVAKLDRLTRSLRDFDDLRIWCDAHGKTIISVSESIDLSTSLGRMFANLLAMFAQFERERMGEPRADAARKARREGRYDGRTVPFGYSVNGGNRYVRDREYAPVAFQMAQDRLSGRSLSWIARDLDRRGVKPRGGAVGWRADKVQKILLNPSLAGIITSDDKILRSEDGKPLRFTHDHDPWGEDCPECPVLGDDDWARLQEAMKTKPRGQRAGGFILTGVAWCQCGQPLYGNRRPGGRQSYYRCSTGATDHKVWCGARTIPSAALEADVEAKVLDVWGDRELYRRTSKPAKDHQAELEHVARQIEDVEREFRAGQWPASSAGRMLASLEAERERLEALPAEPGGEEWEPAGIKVRDYWDSLSGDDDKGHLLKAWGVRIIAQRDSEGEMHVALGHGQPDGFEQASGLLMPHWQGDHEPLFDVGGILVHRDNGGAYEVVKDQADRAVVRAMRDRLGY
jgi:DNA invertase Pin-like site-specific DNA recombinase